MSVSVKSRLKSAVLKTLKKGLHSLGYDIVLHNPRKASLPKGPLDIVAKLFDTTTTPLDFTQIVAFLEDQELTGVTIDTGMDTYPKLCILDRHKAPTLRALSTLLGHDWLQAAHTQTIRVVSPTGALVCAFVLEFWSEEDAYYLAPSTNIISRRLWKTTAEAHGLFQAGQIPDYTSILLYPHEATIPFAVDLVFTWVNADDTDWQKLYQTHAPETVTVTDAEGKSRFYNRDELMYALRSWDQFGTFVRHVFIVSNCAPPAWLDLDNPRVTWVWHEDILPPEALPTFNSHAIETSLHKIPNLSNHFIYSNDDLMLTRQAFAHDFYLPSGIYKPRLEAKGMVTGAPVAGQPDYLNGARNATALLEQMFERSPTQLAIHSPHPLRKDILQELDTHFGPAMKRTAHNKFRSLDDVAVSGYLHAHYGILSGRAVADSTPVKLIQPNHTFAKIFADLIAKKKAGAEQTLPLSICVNDGFDSHLNATWNDAIIRFLTTFYPNKSSFEK